MAASAAAATSAAAAAAVSVDDEEEGEEGEEAISGILVAVNDVVYSGEYVDDYWCSQFQIIGRRQDRRSVVVRVRGFPSYFFCDAAATGPAAVAAMEDALVQYMHAKATTIEETVEREEWKNRANASRAERIRATRVRVKAERWAPLADYQFARNVFRVETSHPHVVAMLRDGIVRGEVAGHLVVGTDPDAIPRAYEANVEFPMRFMIDMGIQTHAWIEVKSAEAQPNTSFCSSPDLICEHPGLIRPIGEEEEKRRALVPAYRILSFDIECKGRRGEFPDPKQDAVIQIACDLVTMDSRPTDEINKDSKAFLLTYKNMDAPGVQEHHRSAINAQLTGDEDAATESVRQANRLATTDAAVVGSDVTTLCYNTEAEMLLGFADNVRRWDPDVITSWNGPNFDWKYIVDRTHALGLDAESRMFSRLHRVELRNDVHKQATKAHGHTETNRVEIPGRFIMDMMDPIMKNYKLRSYKLDHVAHKFLGDRKDDVPYFQITTLWNGSPQDRGKLGHYWYVLLG